MERYPLAQVRAVYLQAAFIAYSEPQNVAILKQLGDSKKP